MGRLTYFELERAYASLLEKYSLLLKEKDAVVEQLEFCTRVPTLRAGIKGEVIISRLIGGKTTAHTAPHDVVAQNGLKLEVKFASLRKIQEPYSRWSWGNPLGMYQGKDYDRLILIGVVDPRYRHEYKDPTSPYIIFDIGYNDVKSLVKNNMIHTTTFPCSGHESVKGLLFNKFQVTLSELEERYGIEEVTSDPFHKSQKNDSSRKTTRITPVAQGNSSLDAERLSRIQKLKEQILQLNELLST